MANAKSSNNKTRVAYPAKYTVNNMSDYLAKKHNISKRQAKEMLEDMFDLINNGVMNGERVPIGKMGKMFIRVRPATKARQGRNPLTGENITIPAKKATKVPKFVFTKTLKTEALKAKIKTK